MRVLENVTAFKYSARDNAAASNHEEMTDKPVIESYQLFFAEYKVNSKLPPWHSLRNEAQNLDQTTLASSDTFVPLISVHVPGSF